LVAARSQAENQFDVDTGSAEQLPVELGPRPDDILPDSLADAVSQVRSIGIGTGDPRHDKIADITMSVVAAYGLHALLQQESHTGTAAGCCSTFTYVCLPCSIH
jgi:hypothetical protein